VLQNTSETYGSVSRFFHWATAVIILCNILMGFVAYRSSMEVVDAKIWYFSIHKTLGVCAFAVALARICWTLFQDHPVPVNPHRRLEVFAANTVHWVLYGSMLLIPLTGWIEHAATNGYAPILWPLGQDLPLVPKSEELAARMAAVHQLLAWMLCAAVALHVAGALKHALIDRDGVVRRMTRGVRAGGGLAPLPLRSVIPAVLALVLFGAVAAVSQWERAPAAASAQTPHLQAAASEWTVIQGTLAFQMKQMGTPVSGSFSDWTASIAFNDQTGLGHVDVVINLASVMLGTIGDQVKGAAFLDVSTHPTARFSARIHPEGDAFVADGSLTLKGVEMPVRLPFQMKIDNGVADMSGHTVLDRRTWKVGDSYPDEKTVGFPVDISVSLQARR
jgi:cytochrome b561/polyisoprenoid-binding protein YceI